MTSHLSIIDLGIAAAVIAILATWLCDRLSSFINSVADHAYGPEQKSLLEDEFMYGAEGGPKNTWKVKSLWIYPIKSCRGIELTESRVLRTGLEYDRQYMLAERKPNAKTGEMELVFITQRQYPLMARIITSISNNNDGDKPSQYSPALSVSFPKQECITWPLLNLFLGHMENFTLPLDVNEKDLLAQYPLVEAKLWKKNVVAHDMTKLLPQGVAQFIKAKYPVILLRMPSNMPRNVSRNTLAANQLGYQPVVSFADCFPVNILNLTSVRDLNSRIKDSIPNLSATRFRSNIILSGPPAFAEDNWIKISIGKHIFHVACKTSRCKLPNIDQYTGQQHSHEPDRAMRMYRKIDKENDGRACMGLQLLPPATAHDENGMKSNVFVRVGDLIRVLEAEEDFFQ